jgi:hypothetical protein
MTDPIKEALEAAAGALRRKSNYSGSEEIANTAVLAFLKTLRGGGYDLHDVACALDHPSVYMGGPSKQSGMNAKRAVNAYLTSLISSIESHGER